MYLHEHVAPYGSGDWLACSQNVANNHSSTERHKGSYEQWREGSTAPWRLARMQTQRRQVQE